MNILTLMNIVHRNAVEKGFHEGDAMDNVWKQLGNIHAEVSEAWEIARTPDFNPTHIWHSDGGKPEGFPIELADILIRVFDTAAAHHIDLEDAIMRKHTFNVGRPTKHGGKRS